MRVKPREALHYENLLARSVRDGPKRPSRTLRASWEMTSHLFSREP
jgi:hypothetical protein